MFIDVYVPTAGTLWPSRTVYDECINQLFIFAVGRVGQRPATVAGSLELRGGHRGRWLLPVPLAAGRLLQRSNLNGQLHGEASFGASFLQ